ncbi:MAG: TlyA family RNA methyltransferase [Rhodobiaceae bacterium]|nr:TlyA family RNA methyltransferase [Rhodobiaceae bacterium]MCC0054772.1 TlyA family RNA methyltransferase [Rhodobiaceae bacterium]
MRLDEELVRRGLCASRARARDSILRGAVTVDGSIVTKPARTVGPEQAIGFDDPAAGYVSRSALKLAAGLDAFGFNPADRVGLDVGASTGGFTQVLLGRGAKMVYAVDVGRDQLAEKIAADERVIVMEGVNARDLDAAQIPDRPGAIVIDVSFISQRLLLPAVLALAAPDAFLVSLVKPQFEVGRDGVGKGGIVRDEGAALSALAAVESAVVDCGFALVGRMDSPIEGGDGNREYLIGAVNGR